MKNILIASLCLLCFGCSTVTSKSYENEVFPQGDWKPVNPEYFGKTEAQRIYEGSVKQQGEVMSKETQEMQQ